MLFVIVLIVIVILFNDIIFVLIFCICMMINEVKMLIGRVIIVIIEDCKWNRNVIYIIVMIVSFLSNLFYRFFIVFFIKLEWL